MWLFSSWLWQRKMQHFNTKDCPKISPDAYIMFEEFYIFATELARLCERGKAVPMSTSHSFNCDGKGTANSTGSKRMAYEVFLGGSCNPTTWRSDIAIPTLQNLGITYYNPQVSQWGPELIAQEYEAKQTARVLLFVIDNQTRNTAGIIEVAQLAATRSESLILVIYPYRQGQTILGEAVSTLEYYDLMNGLLVLQYLMERQKIPIFENISVALNCTSKILREDINIQTLHSEDGIKSTRISLNQNGIDIIMLREIFKSMEVNDSGTVSLREAWLTLQSSARCNMSVSEVCNAVNKSETYRALISSYKGKGDPAEQRIDFEQFCTLSSELPWRTKGNGISYENWTNSFTPETEKKDLYIGVVNNDLLWLESSAAPLIESMGLTYFRPSLNEYNIRILPQELQRMKNSRLIFLIVSQQSRGIAIMALAAHLVGLRAKLVLCVQSLPEDCVLSGEKLSEQATKDYNRARMYLADYATREGVPVFQNVADALQHAIQLVQSSC
ncbi:uncharacterized protein raw isoform X2 [Prorops nasuta]|uniref:uncharacterized protein raw isoform X2 n=1 Tax=Prorops nasuta TaxID=863751 RepID=UPI0034CD6C0E